MKTSAISGDTRLFMEIGQSSFEAACGDGTFAFPIERGEDGRLTDLCKERLTSNLRGFVKGHGCAAGERAWCTVGARGVSLRRLSLPVSAKDEFERVLRLQIESEFPLPPEELAWGWRALGTPANAGGRQELLLVAVKKETLQDYTAVFSACGVVPIFTVAALARMALYAPPEGAGAVLHIGRSRTEWVTFDEAGPSSLRILPWGGENITQALQEKLGVSHDEAERLKTASDSSPPDAAKPGGPLQAAVEAATTTLADYLRSAGLSIIYLTGKGARDGRLAPLLARLLGGGASGASLESAAGNAPSAAIAGLKKATVKGGVNPLLVLEMGEAGGVASSGYPSTWKWAAMAAGLAVAAAFFPYGESLLLKPRLEKKLAAVNADRGRLETIDQEMQFLQDLKQAQPPYLDTLYLLAKAAPQGTRLDTLSLGRKGEISLRAKLQNAQQVTDFRSKLIDSGWFASVVVEEQNPTPDRQVAIRMSAQLNPSDARKPLVISPPTKKSSHAASGPMEMGFAPPDAAPGEAGPMPSSPPMRGGPDGNAPVRRGRRRGGDGGGAGPMPGGPIMVVPSSDNMPTPE